MAADNAGIFFFGPPPSAEDIAAAAEGAVVSISREEHLSRITAEWPDVVLVMTINPLWDREVQLSGLRNWLDLFPASERGTPLTQQLLANLDRTTTCYGSVISPAFDRQGKAASSLMRLLKRSSGFFFSHQSLYDAQGSRIIGRPGDPEILGPKRQ
jgi:hypothetical protein